MNCKRARQNIALFAGNDLDTLTARELRRHLKECRECTAHWQKMKASVDLLQAPEREARPIGDSVWPGLAVRLPQQREAHPADRFNGWGPALAVVAACMVMLFFAQGNPAPINAPQAGSFNVANPLQDNPRFLLPAEGSQQEIDIFDRLSKDLDSHRAPGDDLFTQPRPAIHRP